MAEVMLNQTARTALEREARSQLENAIGERSLGGDSQYGDEQERRLLACADVLAGLGRSGGRLRMAGDSNPVKFTDEAIWWVERQREATEPHVAELEKGDEGDYEYVAGEVYLLHVLKGVLGEAAEAVTV